MLNWFLKLNLLLEFMWNRRNSAFSFQTTLKFSYSEISFPVDKWKITMECLLSKEEFRLLCRTGPIIIYCLRSVIFKETYLSRMSGKSGYNIFTDNIFTPEMFCYNLTHGHSWAKSSHAYLCIVHGCFSAIRQSWGTNGLQS